MKVLFTTVIVAAALCSGCKTNSQGTPGSTAYEERGRSYDEQMEADRMGNRISDNAPNPSGNWRTER